MNFPLPSHGLSYERFCFMKYTIMSKLLEMLANGNRKIAMTIDSEDLMSYVQEVEDAHQKSCAHRRKNY